MDQEKLLVVFEKLTLIFSILTLLLQTESSTLSMFNLSVSSVEQMPTISYLIEKFPINSILIIVPYNKLVLMQVVRAYFKKFLKSLSNLIILV